MKNKSAIQMFRNNTIFNKIKININNNGKIFILIGKITFINNEILLTLLFIQFFYLNNIIFIIIKISLSLRLMII